MLTSLLFALVISLSADSPENCRGAGSYIAPVCVSEHDVVTGAQKKVHECVYNIRVYNYFNTKTV